MCCMIELRVLRKNFEKLKKGLIERGEKLENFFKILKIIENRKKITNSLQKLQQKLNEESKALSNSSIEEIDQRRSFLRNIRTNIQSLETDFQHLENTLTNLILKIPNLPQDDVPLGESEKNNLEIKQIGIPNKFNFKILDHVELGDKLGILDLERSSKISGSRFAFLKGSGSLLNRALMQYLCNFHAGHGDIELTVPYLVKYSSMQATGQFPKFFEDAFQISIPNSESYYLIPTSEVPVTNFHSNEILPEKELPLRYFSHSHCFRAEAGSAGRDTRGLIRQHQFEKVEMVRFCTEQQSEFEFAEMVSRASKILTELNLPHRIVSLCTGDLGFSSQKTYDLEVWLPSQGIYREISSCSIFGTFQSLRAKIKYRDAKGYLKPAFTLNGSGLPLGRTLVAILENNQQINGTVKIPKVLWKYMNGLKVLTRP